jgi:hypothetical protein
MKLLYSLFLVIILATLISEIVSKKEKMNDKDEKQRELDEVLQLPNRWLDIS